MNTFILWGLKFVQINTPSCYSTEKALHPLYTYQPTNYVCRNNYCYSNTSKTCEAVHVHAIKAHRGVKVQLQSFITLVLDIGLWSASRSGRFISWGNSPSKSTEQETGWAPEPVWMFWDREKSLARAGTRIPDCSACSLVTILTTLLGQNTELLSVQKVVLIVTTVH
jgi:hypothetical protein